MDNTLPEKTPCTLNIELFGPASLLSIRMEAEVVRVDGNGNAVEFTNMDLDSLIHLRHLIRVHSMTGTHGRGIHEGSAGLVRISPEHLQIPADKNPRKSTMNAKEDQSVTLEVFANLSRQWRKRWELPSAGRHSAPISRKDATIRVSCVMPQVS